MVNGVNFDSEIADLMLDILSGKFVGATTDLIVESFMKLISLLSTKPLLPQDFEGALKSLSTEGTNAFNKKYPQGLPKIWGGQGKELETNGVYYYSWNGIIKSNAINEGLNTVDPFHAIFIALSAFFKKERKQNDGLVVMPLIWVKLLVLITRWIIWMQLIRLLVHILLNRIL